MNDDITLEKLEVQVVKHMLTWMRMQEEDYAANRELSAQRSTGVVDGLRIALDVVRTARGSHHNSEATR